MAARLTPVMKQHQAAKRAHPDALVFFRLGDFYEMFGEDALVCSRELELTLTSRNKGKPDEIPMAGVPHHAAHGYIGRLLERGYKVAICEQMADPATVKGIVPREVVRVITPGTVLEDEQLEARANSWLAALEVSEAGVGLAFFDLSTAELRATTLGDRTLLLAELAHAAPREVLLASRESARDQDEAGLSHALRQALPRAALRQTAPLGLEEARAQLGPVAEEALRLGESAMLAAARAVRYAAECNPTRTLPLRRVAQWNVADQMSIDAVAANHLELISSASGSTATLLGTLDETRTAAGARLLRRRLLAPLMRVEAIRRRLDQVELFLVHARLREEFRQHLSGVGDIERLLVRVQLGVATPRDLGALRDGLNRAAAAVSALLQASDDALLDVLNLPADVDLVEDLAATLNAALADAPPRQLKEGAVFRPEHDAALAELEGRKQSGARSIVAYETRLREETQISSLKVRFTRVFGWYVEVGRSHAKRVPVSFRRKQTVASGERYTTTELDDLADSVNRAETEQREREVELFDALLETVKKHAARAHALVERVARYDVAQALAEVAHRHDYCRPTVDASDLLEIRDGRHPVVERLAARGRFVPNDVCLDAASERLWLITGPNMAGKSTLLRQVALTVILAQLGSYVPAREARIGVVDRVLSRVGASDNLAAGDSTFMVEMRETASILRLATRRSLVILDEIGRGTSTFDGLAIAWAVADYLAESVACRALFATHYYELTELGEISEHVANFSVSAKELDDDIVFLHRLTAGAASRSYGVFVAKLAGVPEVVLGHARALLKRLEESRGAAAALGTTAGGAALGGRAHARGRAQLDLFQATASPELEEMRSLIQALDLDRLTGIEALTLLGRLKQKLGSGK